MTCLQLALDGSLEDGLNLLRQVHTYVDVVELGTPLIIREGIGAARRIQRAFPSMSLLADLKIVDAGEAEAALAFEAGCRWVTVMGIASDATVHGAVSAAARFGGQVMADLMYVSDTILRGQELLALGCHMLCVHAAYDLQSSGHKPLGALAALRAALPDAPLAVAGGISLDTIQTVMELAPQIVIVGGAIALADNPATAAQRLSEQVGAP